MRHEEEYNRHRSDHQHDRRREPPRYHDEQHFNDFGSRWGEPDPRFNLRNRNWRQDDQDRRRDPEYDWRPFEHRIEEQRRHPEQDYRNREYREPVWRQRDRHFNSSNQHANDRWQYDETMPHPNDQFQYYQEDERRRRRRFRED